MEITDETKNELKKPLGRLYSDITRASNSLLNKRVISIGDICSTNLISQKIIPHLCIFDFKTKREEIDIELRKILINNYPNPHEYINPAGTISEKIIADASTLLQNGGGIKIKGEEDITALAFILVANKNDRIVYGQPNEGIVVVRPTKKLKEKIKKWLF